MLQTRTNRITHPKSVTLPEICGFQAKWRLRMSEMYCISRGIMHFEGLFRIPSYSQFIQSLQNLSNNSLFITSNLLTNREFPDNSNQWDNSMPSKIRPSYCPLHLVQSTEPRIFVVIRYIDPNQRSQNAKIWPRHDLWQDVGVHACCNHIDIGRII
jgi:hypothetical protein